MPEGDTLYRIANKLRPVLVDQVITDAKAWEVRRGPSIDAESLVGKRVTAVEAIGKHLLVTFEDRRVIHSHLGMTGSWHVYAHDEPWRKPAQRAALRLGTESHVVVNFSPKLIEIASRSRVLGDSYLQRLGPDMMKRELDYQFALARLRVHNRTPIGEAVMNQTIVAGIGNVYKSESLFLCRFDPWRQVGKIGDASLLDYLQQTHQLMRKNRRGGMRMTRFAVDGVHKWVYGREGEPCLVCGTQIRMRRQGDQARSTYWCPRCQKQSSQVAST